ncbi:hypothetical protein RDABS01_018416 [Bienertia sinuspersici]
MAPPQGMVRGRTTEYTLKFEFKASNNEVEYKAEFTGFELCLTMEAQYVHLKMDSHLITNQVRGEYEAKDPSMILYLAKVNTLIAKLREFEMELVHGSQNTQTGALSKLASSTLSRLNRFMYLEEHHKRKIDVNSEIHNITLEPSWLDLIIAFALRRIIGRQERSFKIKRTGQFDNLPLRDYVKQFGIKLPYGVVWHPQITNRLKQRTR